MLCLPKQVGGTYFCVYSIVGDHHGFRWASEEVDADTAIKLAFGLRDESIARSYQQVHRLDGLGTQRHGSHGLDAAEDIDLMSAAQMHGGDHGRTLTGLKTTPKPEP